MVITYTGCMRLYSLAGGFLKIPVENLLLMKICTVIAVSPLSPLRTLRFRSANALTTFLRLGPIRNYEISLMEECYHHRYSVV